MAATMTRSTPLIEQGLATWLMPCREPRSLIPISTVRFPIGITSPPRGWLGPQSSWVAPPPVTFPGEPGGTGRWQARIVSS